MLDTVTTSSSRCRPTFVAGLCADRATLAKAGPGGEGVYTSQPYYSPYDLSQPDVKIYRTAIAQYATKQFPLNDFAGSGFSAVINAYEQFKKIGADAVTPQTILSAFDGAKDQKNFLGGSYTCDHAISYAPAVCTTSGVRLLQFKDGQFTDVGGRWFNGTADIKPQS